MNITYLRAYKSFSFALLVFPLLYACSNDIEEFERALAVKKYGVFVNLSPEIEKVFDIPESQTIVQLRVVETSTGVELSQQNLSVDGDVASDEAIPDDGEQRYHVQIFHTSASTNLEPLLIAAASKSSSEKRVEFSVEELSTVNAFDLNGDGAIEETERVLLNFDFDGDSRSNLAEILEGGNPKNSKPTFLSPTMVTLAENNRPRVSAYVFYTASAIGPRRDVSGVAIPMVYAVAVADARLTGRINIDSNSGELSILSGQKLPSFDPNGDNTYSITLTATEYDTVSTLILMLNITDVFNLTVHPASTKTKALHFQWTAITDGNGVAADYYNLLRDIGDGNGFTYVNKQALDGNILPLNIESAEYFLEVALHLSGAFKSSTKFKLEAYRKNADPGFSDTLLITSEVLTLSDSLTFSKDLTSMIGTLTSAANITSTSTFNSVNNGLENYGKSIALSANGSVLAVGVPIADIGLDGKLLNDCNVPVLSQKNCLRSAGVVTIYHKLDNRWQRQIVIVAPNADAEDLFGISVSLSADGDTLAVGSKNESGASRDLTNFSDIASNMTLGDTSNTAPKSGAAYIYSRGMNGVWNPQAQVYVKASNTDAGDEFGSAIALSADGNTLVVSAIFEDGSSSGVTRIADINLGDTLGDIVGSSTPDNSQGSAGAVYVYKREPGGIWNRQTQAYIKALIASAGDWFGTSLSLSANSEILAVSARGLYDRRSEQEMAEGRVLIYQRESNTLWNRLVQGELYVSGRSLKVPFSVALSLDGSTLAIGMKSLIGLAGGSIVLKRNADGLWNSPAVWSRFYASNYESEDHFGSSVALSADGNILVVGASYEDGAAKGVTRLGDIPPGTTLGDTPDGLPDNGASDSGAVYIYHRDIKNQWILQAQAYIKAPNPWVGAPFGMSDGFGVSVALSADGQTLAVGAPRKQIGLDGTKVNDCNVSSPAISVNCQSGAVYLY